MSSDKILSCVRLSTNLYSLSESKYTQELYSFSVIKYAVLYLYLSKTEKVAQIFFF